MQAPILAASEPASRDSTAKTSAAEPRSGRSDPRASAGPPSTALVLDPYQRRYLADQSRWKAACWSRQTGKTFTTLEAVLDVQQAEAAGRKWLPPTPVALAEPDTLLTVIHPVKP